MGTSMTILIICFFCAEAEHFLSFTITELCQAEPHLAMCRRMRGVIHSVKSSGDDLTVKRLGELWKRHAKEGFIRQEGPADDPFESIPTRSPPLSLDSEERQYSRRKHHRGLNDYYQKYPREYDQYSSGQQNAVLYRVYPGLHPKDTSFCSDMRGMFAFTCQPSKPLRIDLVEFCKDYSAFCNIPNFHRLPGPRMGPPVGSTGIGHVGVSGKFGFGIGAVPGLDVGVGWGVDVGPIPGMGESVGVDLGLDLGIMGSKTPEAYRRGMDNPNEKGGGIVGVSGGVGVKAPGTGPIGVGSGVGVGK